jgi:hypothetical protein
MYSVNFQHLFVYRYVLVLVFLFLIELTESRNIVSLVYFIVISGESEFLFYSFV